MKMKIGILLILCMCIPGLVFSGGAREGAAETHLIRAGLAMAEGMVQAKSVNGMYELFKEEIEKNSDGRLKMDIVYGGALGNPDERLSQMRRGSIQMSDAADGNYATIYPDVQVFNLPYLFPTEQIAWQVLDGPIGTRMAEDIRKKTGVRVLGWWESGGFKHYSANKPIVTPNDMRGTKMRVMGPIFSIPIEAMRGSPTPIAFNELYTSLQTGVVDGQDNAVWVFNAVQLFEVQDYLMLDGHIYAFGPLGINDDFYNRLDPELQQVIDDAAAKAIDFNRRVSREQEEDEVAFAEARGVEIIRLTQEQSDAFAEVVQPPVIEWLKQQLDTPSLIEEVMAEVQALR